MDESKELGIGDLQEVAFFPAHQIMVIQPGPHMAAISINDPGLESFELLDGWASELHLKFWGVDGEMDGAFTEEQAAQIINWLFELPDGVTHLAVNCVAGISRSAGVAKFVAEVANLNFPHAYPLYNKKVYSTLRKVWFQQEEELYRIAGEILDKVIEEE